MRRRLCAGALAGALGAAALGACAVVFPLDGFSQKEADASPTLEAAAEGGARCPDAGGASMVRVGAFCIDSTEATNTDYQAFLQADAGAGPPACAQKTTFVPGGTWPPPRGAENHPVGSVDWCDAFAFCAWVGKRLCALRVDGADRRNEWYVACSQDGGRRFPYGDDYQPEYCNGAGSGLGNTVPVATLPKCVGGYEGLFDLSGNVEEWIDDCDDAGTCHARGGGFLSGKLTDGGVAPYQLECSVLGSINRFSKYADVGIRCCSD